MSPRGTKLLRFVIVAIVTIAAISAAAIATGYGTLVAREAPRVGDAQGSRVTCRYLYAGGFHERFAFTPNPDAIVCPHFVSVRSPAPADDVHWAAPLPTNRTVQLECRFIRYPADGDSGLGARFTVDVPLRITVNFSDGRFEIMAPDDQAALGQPQVETAGNRSMLSVIFERGGLPIIGGDRPGRLWLSLFSHDGSAALFLRPPTGALLSSRQGGCRPVA